MVTPPLQAIMGDMNGCASCPVSPLVQGNMKSPTRSAKPPEEFHPVPSRTHAEGASGVSNVKRELAMAGFVVQRGADPGILRRRCIDAGENQCVRA